MIHSQCFHTLYFAKAGGRRKARENIGDFAGFIARSWSKETFCYESIHPNTDETVTDKNANSRSHLSILELKMSAFSLDSGPSSRL
jgi:hypothetical protein